MMIKQQIIPFSNLSEFDSWQSHNCDRCCRYDNTSSKRQNAKCKLAFDLDLACVSEGSISVDTAKSIGFDGVQLNDKCNDFNKPIISKTTDINKK